MKCNIGSSEFKVDIGIIDPDNEKEYLLGILLDGENTLHSSTAQDRFILQPSVLNGLGWNILRVWTLDWFDDKDRVLGNIKAAIDRSFRPHISLCTALCDRRYWHNGYI